MSKSLVKQNAVQETLLKPENELFIKLYLNGEAALRAYATSRGMNLADASQYALSASNSTRLLKSAKICKRLNELMTLGGFTDEGMDKELNFLAHQHADYKAKLGAIKEYNALKGRTNKGNVFSGNTFNLAQILRRANEPIEGTTT